MKRTDRTKRERFRASPAEKELLRLAAIKCDLDKSKLIRRVSLAFAKKVVEGNPE